MVFAAPQQIIPKFLWKQVIRYMSYDNIVKMITITKHFAGIVDEDTGQSNFIEHRSSSIAIVKCNMRRMSYFWKYALQTYIGCEHIPDLLQLIEDDVNHAVDFIYYKVFIKSGEYLFNNASKWYEFNKNRCSIEITGSKTESTIIKSNTNKYDNLHTISVIVHEYFLICHITFCDVLCTFAKYSPGIFFRHIDGDKTNVINHYTDLFMKNCIYVGCCHRNLNLMCI